VKRSHARARSGTERREIALIQPPDCLGHTGCALRLGQFTDPLIDQLRHRTRAHTDDRAAAGHRFDDHEPEGLAAAGLHQVIAGCQPLRHFESVAPVRQDRDVVTRACAAPATDQQQVIGLAEQFHGRAQHVEILLLGEATGIHQQPRLIGQRQSTAQIERAARG